MTIIKKIYNFIFLLEITRVTMLVESIIDIKFLRTKNNISFNVA